MIKTIRGASIAAALTLGLIGSGASFAQDVTYNYDRTADFTKYKTYKWVEITGAKHPDQLTDKNITQTIDAQLVGKGLVKKDADPVDLYVGYQVSVDQEKQITGYGGGMGWRFGGVATAETSTINVGTLLVDIYDPATKTLVWRGSGTESLYPSQDPDKNLKHLQKAVAKLLENFPPLVKK